MSDDQRLERPPEQEPSETEFIRMHNDMFRTTLHMIIGDIFLSPKVEKLSEMQQRQLIICIKTFNNFTPENDPEGMHNRGEIEFEGVWYDWIIALFDRENRDQPAQHPSNQNLTWRRLVITEKNEQLY